MPDKLDLISTIKELEIMKKRCTIIGDRQSYEVYDSAISLLNKYRNSLSSKTESENTDN